MYLKDENKSNDTKLTANMNFTLVSITSLPDNLMYVPGNPLLGVNTTEYYITNDTITNTNNPSLTGPHYARVLEYNSEIISFT